MVGPFQLKSLHSLHVFTMKSPFYNPTHSMKIKTLVHSFQHMWQVLRALTKVKSMFMQLLDKNKDNKTYLDTIKKRKKKKSKKLFSSIIMHYNWCSSNVIPMPQPVVDEVYTRHEYFDSTWNTIVPAEDYYQDELSSQLSGYLKWLEEKVPENSIDGDLYEIDRLADKFIANCHEKFRLEKQESYRRYQEMLARSM